MCIAQGRIERIELSENIILIRRLTDLDLIQVIVIVLIPFAAVTIL